MKKTLILLLSIICISVMAKKEYEPKIVPSKPLNLQKLSYDIYQELQKNGGDIRLGGRQFFAIDMIDNTVFEFSANKTLSRSGERACKFYMAPDGKMYFPRRIDWEVSKDSQGILYQEMKKRWERYLREKEREEELNQ